jgi:hypothetical protein
MQEKLFKCLDEARSLEELKRSEAKPREILPEVQGWPGDRRCERPGHIFPTVKIERRRPRIS